MLAPSLKSEPQRYGRVAVALHRTLAVLIFLQLAGGLAAFNATGGSKIALLRLHAPLGLLIGVLAALRVVWWLSFDRRPDEIAGMPRAQVYAARIVHDFLYLLPLAAAFTGYELLRASGAGRYVFGGAKGPLPEFDMTALSAHGAMAALMAAFIAIHMCAAVHHQLIRRDNLWARMRSDGPVPLTTSAAGETSADSHR